MRINQRKIEAGVKQILEGLLGPQYTADHNFQETPARVARWYAEVFTPRPFSPTVFPESHDQMIILAHHVDWTLCPHHLLPVKLDVSIAYIPQGGVLGLSKLARLIQSNLSEPTLQEELTDDLADDLMSLKPTKDSLPPAGAAVLIYGEHLCMRMRGPKSTGETITSAMRGVFKDHIQTREEFLSLVRRK